MSKAFELVAIDVDRLEPKPWNPDRMSPEMYEKLREPVEKVLQVASRRTGGLTRGRALVEIARAYTAEGEAE